jgi:hypothetical protein
MSTSRLQTGWHKGAIRMPRELHAELHEAAALSGNSLNAEIVSRLQRSFIAPPSAERLDRIESMVKQLLEQRNV